MPRVIFILTVLNAGITSGNIVVTPKVPVVNQTATISCFVPAPRVWYLPVGIVQCSNVACVPESYGTYTFRADSSKTEFIFQSLNRTRDERVWTCQYGNTNYSISLMIYTVPRGLDLTQTPDMNANLGITSITIQCRTTSCTYPEPSIEWLYQDQPTSNTYEMYTRSIPTSIQGPCILPEKIYTGSLSISQNTTWSDNSDKTVTFFCRIGYSDPTKNITSLASKTVTFAVLVTEAFLQQKNQNITSILTVTSGEQVTLTCMTGTSRPTPNIAWYIGSRAVGSGTSLTFTPSNTDHNEVIYCQAYNIDPNLKVNSNKPSLFVRVRVTEAFLQYYNQNITSTLTVTFGEQFTLTCVTGTSRPAPTIGWFLGSWSIGSGTSLNFTPSNTDHNQVIFCQAYNIDSNLKVDSNKPKLFVRVNVSSVILEGSAGGMIVFTEGYPRTLKCISSPSRPMPIIRWFLGNRQVMDNIINIDIIDANELHVLTSEITLVIMRNSSNQTVYCEGFISDQGTTAMSTQVSVDVWYAPDVTVNISGSTVVGFTAVLMCTPQGNPPQYIFHPWIHRVGQTEIRRLYGINTVSLSTLTLSNLSIQDMGTYICTVDNSITALDGQIKQMGDTYVYVQGPPVIGETQSTFTGELSKSASIEIPFYSYSTIETVKFIKQLDSFEIYNTSNISIYIQPSNITMMFYRKKVMIPGYVAVLQFRNQKDTDFGNYTIQISNDQGTVSMQFDLTVSAPPSLPKKFFFSHTEGSFWVFGIEKGFNGGHEQTFIVEYQPFGKPEASWSPVFKINETDLEDPFSNGTYYIKIPKIQDGQYMFRVYAENIKGYTSIIGGVHVEITTALNATTAPLVLQRSDVECQTTSLKIFVPKNLVPGNGTVTWRDSACVVHSNGTHFVDSVGLRDCGTTLTLEADSVVFENDLILHKNGTQMQNGNSIVTYGSDYEFAIPVKCVYPRNSNISTSYIPIVQQVRIMERRNGQLDLTMRQYEAEDYRHPVPFNAYPRQVPLNNDIFIRLAMENNVTGLGLSADNCFATSTPSPVDQNWYQLISSGCPVNNAKIHPSGINDVKFSFHAFNFRHNTSGIVYVHCQVSVCLDTDPACVVGCMTRKKRSASAREGAITSNLISTGPFILAADEGGVAMSTVVAAVSIAAAVIATVVAIIGWTRKSKKGADS